MFIFESLVFVPSVLSYMCYSTTRVFSSCQQDSGRWISMTGWQCSGGADSNDEPLHYQAHTFCFQEWHPFLAVSIVSTNSFNAVFIIKIPPTCIYHVNHLEDVDNFCLYVSTVLGCSSRAPLITDSALGCSSTVSTQCTNMKLGLWEIQFPQIWGDFEESEKILDNLSRHNSDIKIMCSGNKVIILLCFCCEIWHRI